jgi:hypothetical protein
MQSTGTCSLDRGVPGAPIESTLEYQAQFLGRFPQNSFLIGGPTSWNPILCLVVHFEEQDDTHNQRSEHC